MYANVLAAQFEAVYKTHPQTIASAPGRIEVLGNHTDYNGGRTLSCAVGFRCFAALKLLDQPLAVLASTAFDSLPSTFDLANLQHHTPNGHWTDYLLGLVLALNTQGYKVPGFALLVDSQVPRSAGVSSSAALEMAVLTGLVDLMGLETSPLEKAKIGQWAESNAVGAQTGLLDQMTSLCSERDHLLHMDFQSYAHRLIAMPQGCVFVVVDSGVKHDLTKDYNDRRASCEAAARIMGTPDLGTRSKDDVLRFQHKLTLQEFNCALHVVNENQRVKEAGKALELDDMKSFGKLMFDSHASSRELFKNSCSELDELIDFANQDDRCIGARLSGGGFGGITIHLVRAQDSEAYQRDILKAIDLGRHRQRWSCIGENGARIEFGARSRTSP